MHWTTHNLLNLEMAIREAFVPKKHLVSIVFDMEKTYDRTRWYGTFNYLFDTGLKGNFLVFIKNFPQTRIFQIHIDSILQIILINRKASLKEVSWTYYYSSAKLMVMSQTFLHM